MTIDELWDVTMKGGLDGFPHLLMTPFMAWHYHDIIFSKGLDDFLGLSSYIGVIDSRRILARTRKGTVKPLAYQDIKNRATQKEGIFLVVDVFYDSKRGVYNFTLTPAPTPSLRPIELQPM